MEREKKRNPDSVGTFLQTVRSPAQQKLGGPENTLVALLASLGPQNLIELQAKSGLAFADFAAALARLRDAGVVAVRGEPGKETIELTRIPT